MKNLQNWYCKKCNAVFKVSGLMVLSDEAGTALAIYDCPVCGTAENRQRLENVMFIREKMPNMSFMDKLHHMVSLVEEANGELDILEQALKHYPALQLSYNNGCSD